MCTHADEWRKGEHGRMLQAIRGPGLDMVHLISTTVHWPKLGHIVPTQHKDRLENAVFLCGLEKDESMWQIYSISLWHILWRGFSYIRFERDFLVSILFYRVSGQYPNAQDIDSKFRLFKASFSPVYSLVKKWNLLKSTPHFVLVSFQFLWQNTWENQLRGRKVHFGLWFQRLQYIVTWHHWFLGLWWGRTS